MNLIIMFTILILCPIVATLITILDFFIPFFKRHSISEYATPLSQKQEFNLLLKANLIEAIMFCAGLLVGGWFL